MSPSQRTINSPSSFKASLKQRYTHRPYPGSFSTTTRAPAREAVLNVSSRLLLSTTIICRTRGCRLKSATASPILASSLYAVSATTTRLSATALRTLRRELLRLAGSRRARSRAASPTPKVEGTPLYQRIAIFHERNGSPSWKSRRNTEKTMLKKYRPTPQTTSSVPRKKRGGSSFSRLIEVLSTTSRTLHPT